MRIFRGALAAAVVSAVLMGTSAAFAEMVLHRGNSGDPETLDPQKTVRQSVEEGAQDVIRMLREFARSSQRPKSMKATWRRQLAVA